MAATLNDVVKKKSGGLSAEAQAAAEVVRLAKEQGLSLTGPDGLLKQLTKTVLETALNEEITEHLGYEKHDPAGAGSGNIRNGTRAKTVLTGATGQVEIDVPRDRAGTFEPQIVKKRQRRLNGVDEVVLSLYAKGLTTGEISAHFAEIYGASVSKETISRITDKVIEEMNDWSVRRVCCIDRSPRRGGRSGRGSWAGASTSNRPSARRPVGVRRVPVPAGGDHGRGPLVPALRAVLPRCGGAAGRARRRGRPRDRVPVGAAVHAAVRRRRPPAPARHRGPVVRR